MTWITATARSGVLVVSIAVALSVLSAAPSRAETDCEPDCATVGEWQFGVAVGYGEAANPVVDHDNVDLVLLPRLSYYGERFFLETRSLGYTLIDEPTWRLNLLAWPNRDYGWFRDGGAAGAGLIPPLAIPVPTTGYIGGDPPEPIIGTLEKRRLTYLAGIEASHFAGDFQLQWRLGSDVSAGHDGWQGELQLSRHWHWRDTRVQADFGLQYRSSKLSDYYYGVANGEALDPFYRYRPSGSISPGFGAQLHHRVSEQIGILVTFAGQKAAAPIANSPLIETRWWHIGFVGLTYDF